MCVHCGVFHGSLIRSHMDMATFIHPACGVGRFGYVQLPSLLFFSLEGVAFALAAGNPRSQTFPFAVGNWCSWGLSS